MDLMTSVALTVGLTFLMGYCIDFGHGWSRGANGLYSLILLGAAAVGAGLLWCLALLLSNPVVLIPIGGTYFIYRKLTR